MAEDAVLVLQPQVWGAPHSQGLGTSLIPYKQGCSITVFMNSRLQQIKHSCRAQGKHAGWCAAGVEPWQAAVTGENLNQLVVSTWWMVSCGMAAVTSCLVCD